MAVFYKLLLIDFFVVRCSYGMVVMLLNDLAATILLCCYLVVDVDVDDVICYLHLCTNVFLMAEICLQLLTSSPCFLWIRIEVW